MYNGVVSVLPGGSVAPGTNGVGTLTFAGGLILTNGAALAMDLGTTSDLITMTRITRISVAEEESWLHRIGEARRLRIMFPIRVHRRHLRLPPPSPNVLRLRVGAGVGVS